MIFTPSRPQPPDLESRVRELEYKVEVRMIAMADERDNLEKECLRLRARVVQLEDELTLALAKHKRERGW